MSFEKYPRAYLILADGTIFEGFAMGKAGTTIGEVVFNTCMESYGELLSDPTYYGQIVAQTYPLVGNRGVETEDKSTDIMASGYVVREWCECPVDTITLDKYLKDRNIVGISGIDTRRLTRAVRDKGYINGAITDSKDNLEELLKRIKEYTISGAVEAVTTKQVENIGCESPKFNIVAVDYGFSRNMLKAFTKRGCSITIVPAETAAQEILAYNPNGILLSDGPADPDDNLKLIDTIKELTKKDIPIFAVGLGHQMIALALGGKVEKMQRGHRGSNQPVRITGTDKIMVTTQNHGYAVAKGSIDNSIADEWLTNINDNSNEGLKFKSFKGLAVQFIPKDVEGFCDNSWIYDEFVSMMEGNHNEKV